MLDLEGKASTNLGSEPQGYVEKVFANLTAEEKQVVEAIADPEKRVTSDPLFRLHSALTSAIDEACKELQKDAEYATLSPEVLTALVVKRINDSINQDSVRKIELFLKVLKSPS